MNYKKIIFLILVLLIFFGISFYQKTSSTNRKNNVKITLDHSKEFSREELEKGAEIVLRSFDSTWSESKLHEIRFDNNVYQREMTTREPGTSRFSDLNKDNVLIFITSFTTGQNVKGSIEPNTSVEGWQFILSRQNKNSNWKFLDQGI